jgi:mersacidin/lichenicidin family type 2 lantibiotic
MSESDPIRAWKDPAYRRSLVERGVTVPPHPAGLIELSDDDLSPVYGGQGCSGPLSTYGTYTSKGWRCL